MAYSPQPKRGDKDQPRAQIQLNVIIVTALTNVKGTPLKPLTITLYLYHFLKRQLFDILNIVVFC